MVLVLFELGFSLVSLRFQCGSSVIVELGFSVLVWCYCCLGLAFFGCEFGFCLVWAFCAFCYSAV